MNSQQSQRQRMARRSIIGAKRSQGTATPAQLYTSVQVDKVFRFKTSSASTSSSINAQSLGHLLAMALTATTAADLANNVRVRAIEMWGPPSSDLVPVTVSCEYAGANTGGFGNSKVKSDTSVGSTRVAHVKCYPPKGSQAAQWQLASTQNGLFTLVFPTNTIIDLHYSIMMQDKAGVLTGDTIAGAIAGQLYLRPLDGNGGIIVPVSFISI